MPRRPSAAAAAAALVVALGAALGGCADAVDPTLGTDQAFSLYGYLDPTAERQAIRVVPITATLEADTARALDAVVNSVEPATGRTATWRDSVVTYDDGTTGHVFVADYTPTAGAAVELAVRAGDGEGARVAVEVPALVRPTAGEPSEAVPGTYPVSVVGVPRVLGATLRVVAADGGDTLSVEVPLPPLSAVADGGGWRLEVPFLDATRAHFQELGLFNRGLTLVEATVAPFVADAGWAVPEGGFDEDRIVEPGAFSNVAGGLGFVGAGYRAPVRIEPSAAIQVLAGFAVTSDPAAKLAVNEVGDGYVELYNPTALPVVLDGYTVSASGPTGGVRIARGAVAEPGGFYVVRGPFAADQDVVAQLFSPTGRLLKQGYVAYGAEAWGAFPDGYSFRPPQADDDLFYGPVVPSPGLPNRPREVFARINEVMVAGEGFVEVVPTSPTLKPLSVVTLDGGVRQSERPAGGRPYLVAPESASFGLDPLGSEVYLAVRTDLRPPLVDFQVVDLRRYGPLVVGRSEGYADGDLGGAWVGGLRPTPGAANVPARLAAR